MSRMLDYQPPRPNTFPTWWRENRRGMRWYFAAAIGLMAVELYFAALAWHTIGEVVSGFVFVLLGNAVAVGVAFASRLAAWVLLVALALLIIPWQAVLGVRWGRVHREAERIVAYVQAQHAATGQYPPNLNSYTFRDAGTRPYIEYIAGVDSAGFEVHYRVGSGGTAHTWHDQSTKWFYYPD